MSFPAEGCDSAFPDRPHRRSTRSSGGAALCRCLPHSVRTSRSRGRRVTCLSAWLDCYAAIALVSSFGLSSPQAAFTKCQPSSACVGGRWWSKQQYDEKLDLLVKADGGGVEFNLANRHVVTWANMQCAKGYVNELQGTRHVRNSSAVCHQGSISRVYHVHLACVPCVPARISHASWPGELELILTAPCSSCDRNYFGSGTFKREGRLCTQCQSPVILAVREGRVLFWPWMGHGSAVLRFGRLVRATPQSIPPSLRAIVGHLDR